MEEDEGRGRWGKAEDERVEMGQGGFHAGGGERGLEVDVPSEEFDGREGCERYGAEGFSAGKPEAVSEGVKALRLGVEEVGAIHF